MNHPGKIITLLFTVITFFSLTIVLNSAEDDNSPIKPYLNGTTALKKLDFGRTQKWFDITIRDFPKSDFALEARVHNLIIILSHELAYLRLFKLWESGSKNIFEVDSELSDRKKGEFEKKIAEYKKENETFKKKLLNNTIDFLRLDKIKELNLNFSLLLENWDSMAERSEIEKGIFILSDKIDRVKENEILLNYLGLLESLFKTTFNKEELNQISGQFDLLVFYTAMGSRLYYIGESEKDGRIYFNNAKAMLERGLETSSTDLYREEREKAKELLEKIRVKIENKNDRSIHAKETQLICPKCKKEYEEFKFCPNDGAKLEKKK